MVRAKSPPAIEPDLELLGKFLSTSRRDREDPLCPFARNLVDMEDQQIAETVRAAIAKGAAPNRIYNVLKDRGLVTVGVGSVLKHASGRCKCPKTSSET